MRPLYRLREWPADPIGWVQYPKPKPRSLRGHPHRDGEPVTPE